ncbi:GNAT family N-acetyltransferase [Paenibacillus psychroresistens]|uniref:GNAT family N-acetyltransferase n=1 Tax=Paenibacillus psychroresistens TaxID=1778678 RepID=A0A6B8RP81_9BACL|nr:GNAT family N-acetyltransferase [Paenibacillus psychroresistens]QGQ98150.1 GNAT family N-acetyltransferase [Paenibacillus psychroresistens]
MTEIVRKLTKQDLNDFWEIVVTASGEGHSRDYKAGRVQWFETILDEYNDFGYYGLFRDEILLGGMAIIDFRMNLLCSSLIEVGGVGMIHVDLLHKKEKVCRNMMLYFMELILGKGKNMVVLSPFNVDFYKKMGFGYGTKIHEFRVLPASFPKGSSRENLVHLNVEDKQLFIDCYKRFQAKTHGFLNQTWFGLQDIFGSQKRIVAYKKDDVIHGYIVFDFQAKDLIVEEIIFETREALSELCTFLNAQSDQINRIIFRSHLEQAHFLFTDPTNGLNSLPLETNVDGIGMMYRIINVQGIFEDLSNHNFNDQSCIVKISIRDTLLPSNNGSTIIQFQNGRSTRAEYDSFQVEINLDISDGFLKIYIRSHSISHFGQVECDFFMMSQYLQSQKVHLGVVDFADFIRVK